MPQNFEIITGEIRKSFLELKKENPAVFKERLKLSWSNWGFGFERLEDSAARLARNGIGYIELHGNHYGSDLGYKPAEAKAVLERFGLKVSGVCGMFSPECDLSSNNPRHRQAAIDYIKREVAFTAEMGGEYLLVVPAAVGRPDKYDDMELQRSAETLNIVAGLFVSHGVKAAIEPIRSAETSIVHTVAEAKRYIGAVNHPGVAHINGDVYHMQSEEAHIGQALLDAGQTLVNLHMADSTRGALGTGSLDLDCIIMALYLLGYNQRRCFVTPEPLGPGGNPYPAMHGRPNPELLEQLVSQTAQYFAQRENELLATAG